MGFGHTAARFSDGSTAKSGHAGSGVDLFRWLAPPGNAPAHAPMSRRNPPWLSFVRRNGVCPSVGRRSADFEQALRVLAMSLSNLGRQSYPLGWPSVMRAGAMAGLHGALRFLSVSYDGRFGSLGQRIPRNNISDKILDYTLALLSNMHAYLPNALDFSAHKARVRSGDCCVQAAWSTRTPDTLDRDGGLSAVGRANRPWRTT